ncbi:syntaxin binding protein 1 [Dipsacomyces acuminosporus]|nr:syntaxin binding protein 1 [Dipsacomyces acuminosporus]
MESHDTKQPRSLIDLLRKDIIDAIMLTKTPNKWRVLVVDKPSLKIVSSVLSMSAVLEHNVTAVQLITKKRQPYPSMGAIYILVPCSDSISRVIQDLSQQKQRQPMYAHAHLFFTGALRDGLLARLSSSPAAQHIKGIRELFIEFNPTPFYTLYSPHGAGSLTADLDAAADRLLSVIASLGVKPYIRYYRPRLSTDISLTDITRVSPHAEWAGTPRIAEAMANRLQLKLDEYYLHEKRKGKERTAFPVSVVIVLDRSIDLYSPLVHEFTYQAMVNDLVDLQNGEVYTFGIETTAGEKKSVEAKLNEREDPLWKTLRHMHITQAIEALTDRFNRLVEDNVGIAAIQEK